ncbi:MurR/RpiR family transcriptional regulator [Oceanobacillus saliphilus]|uniref:MurR/RpiR family transcriptional regulator n=1 Tax=Oceanobacillus saliphilus TaxID=2925834 RepID=UPI00201E156E|nr:MurR/RpiR family transcriptional regulator [Oceanobacillus saliphilus]
MGGNYVGKTKEMMPDLTKGMRKVATYILSDPIVFAIYPAKKVGEIIGVSETMVIRFCNTIGYKGFSELQKEVRQHLLDFNESVYSDVKSNKDMANKYENSMNDDLRNINLNMKNLDVQAIDDAIEHIISSRKVVVAGYYHSFAFAHWFSYNLNFILGNATLYRPESDAGLLDLLPEKSCIVIFSFFRYALDTIRLAEEAKKQGIKVITITDSWVSPVTEYADIVIPLSVHESKTLFNKGPVTMSLINSVLFEIINLTEERGKIQPAYKYFIKDGEE